MQRIRLDEVILSVLDVFSCHNILLFKEQSENKSSFKFSQAMFQVFMNTI